MEPFMELCRTEVDLLGAPEKRSRSSPTCGLGATVVASSIDAYLQLLPAPVNDPAHTATGTSPALAPVSPAPESEEGEKTPTPHASEEPLTA